MSHDSKSKTTLRRMVRRRDKQPEQAPAPERNAERAKASETPRAQSWASMRGDADPADLEGLGFLPPGLAGLVRRAGDSSLAGAALPPTRPAPRRPLEELAGQGRVLDLASSADFSTAFINRMVPRYVP